MHIYSEDVVQELQDVNGRYPNASYSRYKKDAEVDNREAGG